MDQSMQVTGDQPPALDSSEGRFAHHGSGGELFLIMLMNMVLKVVTLGVYHFWAKTRVRRYLWSQTAYRDERFEYTGTGLDLLLGFLQAVVMMALAVVGGLLVLKMFPETLPALLLVGYLMLLWLMGAAGFGAAGYRLRHTRWRGIRFALSGSAARHGWLFLAHLLISALTLGLAHPYARMLLLRHFYSGLRFGSEPFRFDGRARDLVGRWLLAWVLLIPTLGLSLLWYQAAESRYVASRMRLQDMEFNLALSGGALLWLVVGNLLLLVFTLGLALPWVMVRNARFLMERLSTRGEVDFNAVYQSQGQSGTAGEGFAEALDLGGI